MSLRLVSGDGTVDGRRLRGDQTRRRIVQAVIDMVAEDISRVRSAEIARRARVSVRTIFQHFPDLGLLYLSAADAQLHQILAALPPAKTDGSLVDRVVWFVSERAALAEQTLPMRRLAANCRTFPDDGKAPSRTGHDLQRKRSENAFGAELTPLPEAVRERLLDAIEGATDGHAWALLRFPMGLDVEAAKHVWRLLLLAFLQEALNGEILKMPLPSPQGVEAPGRDARSRTVALSSPPGSTSRLPGAVVS